MTNQRSSTVAHDELQSRNKGWWEANPMSYDWHGTLEAEEGTTEFFDSIDRRFFSSSSLYRGSRPFEKWIPFQTLPGKAVLEIGCGLGSHAQLLAESGCRLDCVDLTEKGVGNTRRRLALRGLTARVQRMDAEHLEFADHEFDMVWTWGVIHHSADTDGILREIVRVLKPGGELRVMVYHKRSLHGLYCLLRGLLSGKFFKGMSQQDVLSHYTDGYLARFYTRREFRELLESVGLTDVRTSLLGQQSELLPLPGKGIAGRVKQGLLALTPDSLSERVLSVAGYFLFATAKKPTAPAAVA